jgi:hypothetical protein
VRLSGEAVSPRTEPGLPFWLGVHVSDVHSVCSAANMGCVQLVSLSSREWPFLANSSALPVLTHLLRLESVVGCVIHDRFDCDSPVHELALTLELKVSEMPCGEEPPPGSVALREQYPRFHGPRCR